MTRPTPAARGQPTSRVRYQRRAAARVDAVAGVDLTLRRRRDAGARRRVRLGQVDDRARHRRAPAAGGDRRAAARSASTASTSPRSASAGCGRSAAARSALIPQDPTVSLNPVKRIGAQVAEVLRIHGLADRRTAAIAARRGARRAGIPIPRRAPASTRTSSPAACASACSSPSPSPPGPRLIIADEPTSALDVTVQRQILDHIAELTTAVGRGRAADHPRPRRRRRARRPHRRDVAGAHRRGRHARDEVLVRPGDAYTRTLIAAAPSLTTDRPSLVEARTARAEIDRDGDGARPTPIIEAHGLVKDVRAAPAAGGDGVVRAVDDVDFARARAAGPSPSSASPARASRRPPGCCCAWSTRRPGTSRFDGDGRHQLARSAAARSCAGGCSSSTRTPTRR